MYLLAPLVLLWVYHLAQRRYAEVGDRKRMASLLLTVALLVLWVCIYIFSRYAIDDVFLIPVVSLAVALVAWQRARFLPYRFSCAQCGVSLPLQRVLFIDSNLCASCDVDSKKSTEGDEVQ